MRGQRRGFFGGGDPSGVLDLGSFERGQNAGLVAGRGRLPAPVSSSKLEKVMGLVTATGSSGAFAASGPAAPYGLPLLPVHQSSFDSRVSLRPPLGSAVAPGTPRAPYHRDAASRDASRRRPLPPVARRAATDRSRPSGPPDSREPRPSTLNVSWSSTWPAAAEPEELVPAPSETGQRAPVRRRYFFTHRGYDDERTSRIPGHFDVLLEDPARTTSRTDHLRCSYIDFLGPQRDGEDTVSAAALTAQLRAGDSGSAPNLDVSPADRPSDMHPPA